jgi:hypothetical protein
LDPFTKKPVYTARQVKDRRMQRALLQFFKPENYFEVRRALEQAGRQDLIGNGCDCLIPDRPPQEALDDRRAKAKRALGEQIDGDHIRGKPGGGKPSGGASGGQSNSGYRPHRSTQQRRRRD